MIRTLSSTHDVLVPEDQQLWLSHPFPYAKDALVLEFDLTVPKTGTVQVILQVYFGIARFLMKYGALLGIDLEDHMETLGRIRELKYAIPTLMV